MSGGATGSGGDPADGAGGDARLRGDDAAPADGEDAAAATDDGRPVRGDDVPDWDDEYLDRVGDRLFTHFDLERDRRVRGERFDVHGRMEVHNQKHFLHPSLSFAHHVNYEYLLARRETPDVPALERLVDLGHELADERIDPDEEHYSTEFSFVLVADEISPEVREFVSGFRERTLLKYGYNGHYEIHLVVVAPEREEMVTSERADVGEAFRLWSRSERRGLLGRLAERFA